MKNLIIGMLSLLLVVIASCSKTGKAVDEYCNCVSSGINDKLISGDAINGTKKSCYDSIIIKKYALDKDAQFISGLDSIKAVKGLTKVINAKIIKNINDILIKYAFKSEAAEEGRYFGQRTYLFDGKMFSQTLKVVKNAFIGEEEDGKWTGTYTVEINNGNAYLTLKFDDGTTDIYKMLLSQKDGYYLEGKRRMWQENK